MAINAQEQILARGLEPNRRVDVGGIYNHVYSFAVMLLLVHPKNEKGWPESPFFEAFNLIEKSRSHVLLELLGEHMLLEPPDHAKPLLISERTRLKEFLESWRGLDRAKPDAFERLRQQRQALQQSYSGVFQAELAVRSMWNCGKVYHQASLTFGFCCMELNNETKDLQ